MRKLVVALAAVAAVASVFVVSASGTQQVIANPATACKALVAQPGTGYTDFGTCVSTVWQGVSAYQFPDEDTGQVIGLDQRCAFFESIGAFTYPGTYLAEGPDWPFVTFTINNHEQCMLALYTYHTLAITAGGG
jgi:hypothetical protein